MHHSDLRSSNVLLAADGTAKLGDVGLAALTAGVSRARSSEAAFPYAAPELLMGARCTEKVGMRSFQSLSPFGSASQFHAARQVLVDRRKPSPALPLQ